MPKKPAKNKPDKSPQPEPAQLKAVERLIEAADYPPAIARARALVQRYPDYGGARRLLIDALYRGQGQGAAALAAYEWAQHRPNSLPAQEALFQLALDGRHFLIAQRVAERLRDLGAVTRGLPMTAEALDGLLKQHDGSRASREEVEQFDLGKLHLDAHDFAGAVRILDGVAITPARNNRALCLFHLNRIEEALAAFLDAWQQDPGNLFALGFALQLRLYRGDETGARALVPPLAEAAARRTEDALAQVAALLLMREDQAAWDAFERARQAAWVAHETGQLQAMWLQDGGAAASRLGRGDQARALWERALAMSPGFPLPTENLNVLDRDGRAPAYPAVFLRGQGLPVSWTDGLRTLDVAGLESHLAALSAADAYLEALYLGGEAALRGLTAYLLKHRLDRVPTVRGRHAAVILRDLARLPIGTPKERSGFLGALREHGLLASDEAVELWNGKELREVNMLSTHIDRESEPSDLPADLQALLDESLLLHRGGRFAAAEDRINAILERIPEHRAALGQLAAIRGSQGRRQEVQAILQRVIAAHPDDLLARCNLAAIQIEDGDLDTARGLLSGLARRPHLHQREAFALYGVTAMLNRALGEDEAAAALIASLEQMVGDEDDARLLAIAKGRLLRVRAGSDIRKT